ncbi:MAG: thioredoxin domain-containing protein [Spirochaetes bacterium]|nr:thioredoxin domain-containing protein [Spirochaetota bacterium]
MKKYIVPAMILSIIGGFLSVLLLTQHYNVNSGIVTFLCGDSVNNFCKELSSSGYSTLFGYPVAVYGFLFYFFILINSIFLFYAGEDYRYAYLFIALPLASAALIASVIFIIIMIKVQMFCSMCLLAHLINLLLLIVMLFYFRKIKSSEGFNVSSLLDKYTDIIKTSSHARAALSIFIAFIIFFIFSVFSVSKVIDSGASRKASFKTLAYYLTRYNKAEPEKLNLHNSTLVSGEEEAELKIIVFTDFLCSYCYKFHVIEKGLIKKFKDSIRFEYYNFPLDTQCNKNVTRSVYPNSCIASKAMFAAAKLGFFHEYINEHFNNYKELKKNYSLEKAAGLLNNIGRDSLKGKFISLVNSREISVMLQKDINAAKKNSINATPSIFIAGKRVGGVVPVQVFEAIISKELRKPGKNEKDN